LSSKTKYSRILLKLSGGALSGDDKRALDPAVLKYTVEEILAIVDNGIQVAVVTGGGNHFRGRDAASWGLGRVTTDYMGMLGTVMNGLALVDSINAHGGKAVLQSAVAIPEIAPQYSREKTQRAFKKSAVVIFVGGTGRPFFSTDTTAALRACEIGADILFKATDVDGVYDKNPDGAPDAKLFESISYAEVLRRGLKVLDSTATALCMDNKIPILVFNMCCSGNLSRAARGEKVGTLVG
jgi:uridylate kinase